jgi:hypothetical protein
MPPKREAHSSLLKKQSDRLSLRPESLPSPKSRCTVLPTAPYGWSFHLPNLVTRSLLTGCSWWRAGRGSRRDGVNLHGVEIVGDVFGKSSTISEYIYIPVGRNGRGDHLLELDPAGPGCRRDLMRPGRLRLDGRCPLFASSGQQRADHRRVALGQGRHDTRDLDGVPADASSRSSSATCWRSR